MNLRLEVYSIFVWLFYFLTNQKNYTAVLEPWTGHFRGIELRSQGLHKVSSRPRASSRTSPPIATPFDFTPKSICIFFQILYVAFSKFFFFFGGFY